MKGRSLASDSVCTKQAWRIPNQTNYTRCTEHVEGPKNRNTLEGVQYENIRRKEGRVGESGVRGKDTPGTKEHEGYGQRG